MDEVIIIGTRPPCPRCKLLGDAVDGLVGELGLSAQVCHYSYTDAEAVGIGRQVSLSTGTAKDVAKALAISLDLTEFGQIRADKDREENREYLPYNTCGWSVELDEFLRPYQERALEAGILMTPVLLINGVIKNSGHVPPLAMVRLWLEELRK